MDKVVINKCESYDLAFITDIIHKQIELLDINATDFKGKRVMIKPNLLMKASPDKAVTTNPIVIEAACNVLIGFGASVIIAESPGGIYTPAILKGLYKSCGITDIAERTGAELNYDVSFKEIHTPNECTTKSFSLITPLCDADYIVNICKLKTHMLAMMSGAVKNYYGCIPGIQKFELHARFKDRMQFFSMLNDLCKIICDLKPMLNIVDAVVGMEGNGPSGGSPRKIGCILSSKNPFTLDLINSNLLNFNGIVSTVTISQQRKYCPDNISGVDILGERLENFIISDFKMPDTKLSKTFSLIPPFLQPRPVVERKKCVACGDCINSCPVKTIVLKDKKAKIIPNKCIKCYCCQELCKYKAIKIKKNIIYKIIK